MLALDDLGEATDGLADRHIRAGHAGELLGHVEGLRQEALDLTGTANQQLVVIRQFVYLSKNLRRLLWRCFLNISCKLVIRIFFKLIQVFFLRPDIRMSK